MSEISGLGERVLTLLGVSGARGALGSDQSATRSCRLLYRTDALVARHEARRRGGRGRLALRQPGGAARRRAGRPLTFSVRRWTSRARPAHVRTTSVAVAGCTALSGTSRTRRSGASSTSRSIRRTPTRLPPPTFLIMDRGHIPGGNCRARVVRDRRRVGVPARRLLARPSSSAKEPRARRSTSSRASFRPARRRTEVVNCDELRCATATLLPTVIGEAEEEVSALRGPADLLATAGTLVALAVVAAAGAFLVARRRTEAMLLHARGMSPWAFAGKTIDRDASAGARRHGGRIRRRDRRDRCWSARRSRRSRARSGRPLRPPRSGLPAALAVLGLVAGLVFLASRIGRGLAPACSASCPGRSGCSSRRRSASSG